MKITNQLSDKIKGLIFGQAIGDALGLATEFMTLNEIQINYPNGIQKYSDILQDKHRSRWKVGDWTDDTDQMICIIDSIVQTNFLDKSNVARHFFEWFQNGGMGIGRSTFKVLNFPQYTLNPEKAAEHVWKMGKMKNASNGAIMRTSILGTWDFLELDKVIENTVNICKLTHPDPRCIGSCVVITSLIRSILLNEEIIFEKLIKTAKDYDSRIIEYIELGKNGTIEQLDLSNEMEIGYTLKTMASGLWAFSNTTNFKDTIMQIILQGGDADTNASVAGAILGVKFGFSNLPNELIEGLIYKNELEEKAEQYIELALKCTNKN
jgi:ADP-ribosylglycohydrolase